MVSVNSVSGGALQQGLQGMQRSQKEMLKSAQDIASANVQTPTQDLVEPIINMKVEKLLFTASAKVVETADQTIGALLDIKA